MVYTRSKARQEAEESAQQESSDDGVPQASKGNAKPLKKSRKSTAQVRTTMSASSTSAADKPICIASMDETGTESIEELALRALQVMKKRLGKRGPEKCKMESDYDLNGTETDSECDQNGMETVNVEPDVMLLESEPGSKQGSAPASARPSGLLATSLQPCMNKTLYFNYNRKKGLSQSARKSAPLSWGEGEEELMKKSVITSDFEKRETAPPMYVSKYARAKARKETREKSTGSGWYEMKAPQMTTELQHDLKLLRMRNALDPSQHYKATDWKNLPRYFQVGKVVSGPAEFYSGRIPKRQRRQTIMNELLHNHQFRRYQKKKYAELQRKFTSGRHRKKFIKHKKHYKKK